MSDDRFSSIQAPSCSLTSLLNRPRLARVSSAASLRLARSDWSLSERTTRAPPADRPRRAVAPKRKSDESDEPKSKDKGSKASKAAKQDPVRATVEEAQAATAHRRSHRADAPHPDFRRSSRD